MVPSTCHSRSPQPRAGGGYSPLGDLLLNLVRAETPLDYNSSQSTRTRPASDRYCLAGRATCSPSRRISPLFWTFSFEIYHTRKANVARATFPSPCNSEFFGTHPRLLL